jgi:hypothetical protein
MRAVLRLLLEGVIGVSLALFALLLQRALHRFSLRSRQYGSVSRLEPATIWNEGRLRRPAFLSRSL